MRLALLLLALFAPVGFGQQLAYDRLTLDNGLTVILHEDHRLPLVSINTWFYVGAKDEPVGRSGFAHLFEHLMFMGTDRVPEGAFDTIMEGKGGANNASTDFDRTNYFSWGPAEILPTLLWLDADRLEGLSRAMTQEKLDLQREVVRNERRQTSENVPYGKSELRMVDLLYPEGHPYHDDVIGSHADLEAATVADVNEFFANFYVPNNASLVVAGDFDPAEVKPLVTALFGDIAAGPAPSRRDASPPRLNGEMRQTMFDQVRLPMLRMGWISPSAYAEGDAEMEIAADLLGRDRSGALYRRLVIEEELAIGLRVSQQSLVLGSSFTLAIVVRDAAKLDRVERIVDEELAKLSTWGAADAELQRSKVLLEREGIDSLQDLGQKADLLNRYQFYFNEPDSLARDLSRYRAVTSTSIAKACRSVFGPNRVVIRVLPEEAPIASSARDEMPADLPVGKFEMAAPEEFTTANGIPVQLWSRRDLPLVEVGLLLFPNDGGPIDAPDRVGASSLLTEMLMEGAGDRVGDAFAVALEELGAELNVSSDRYSVDVTLSALRRNLAPSLDLMTDAVLRPRMEPAAFERVKRLRIDGLRQRGDRPQVIGMEVAERLLFGEGHPSAVPVSGTIPSVSSVELSDVVARYHELMRRPYARFVVAGDITRKEVTALLDARFGSWNDARSKAKVSADWAIPREESLRVVVVDRPGAVQTFVAFVMPGIEASSPKRVPYQMIGTILGGSFTSRLNQNLREDKGYTYGASCRFRLDPRAGTVVASSSVRTDVTGASISEFLTELDGIRSGNISADEVTKARGTIRTGVINSVESLAGLVNVAFRQQLAGLDLGTIESDLAALNEISAEDLNRVVRDALPLEQGVLILVGDEAEIRRQLEGLPIPSPVTVEAGAEN